MQKYEQNILTNSGHCSDLVANKVINKGRLGFCQRVVNLFVKFLSRRRYMVLNLVIRDVKDKKTYKAKDFDL